MAADILLLDNLELEPEMEIAEDIFTPQGNLILSKGTILTKKLISGLILLDIKNIPIAQSKKLEVENGPVIEEKFAQEYEQQLLTIENKINSLQKGEKINTEQLVAITKSMITTLEEPKNVFQQMRKLKEMSNVIYKHSLNVSLICHLFAQWFKFIPELEKELVTAALLHDIGKLFVADNYEQHTVQGAKFVAEHGASKAVQLGVLMHHEKEDGSGFPTKAKWWTIHPFAKIISIADYYDNATSGGQYVQKKICPFKMINLLEKERYGYFDIKYMDMFLSKIAEYHLGELVKLTDSRIARIIFINKHCLGKPIVQVGQELIDLYQEKELQIYELI